MIVEASRVAWQGMSPLQLCVLFPLVLLVHSGSTVLRGVDGAVTMAIGKLLLPLVDALHAWMGVRETCQQ